MAAIIKSEDQDAWGGGSAGSRKKLTKVDVLGGEPCQRAEHDCQGIYHCNQLDRSLLDSYVRYGPESDEDRRQKIWNAQSVIAKVQSKTVEGLVADFYREVYQVKCAYIVENEKVCSGVPVMRQLSKRSFDGQKYFVACSGWSSAHPHNAHRFISIPRHVDEMVLLSLFRNNGAFDDAPMGITETGRCATIVKPRNAKGERKCAHTHLDHDGQVVEGQLVHQKCNTKLTIYYPDDRTKRIAVVIPHNGAHNHPTPTKTKVSQNGRDLYEKAVSAAVVSGGAVTVLKCDRAATTQQIFGGHAPPEVDPALSISRNKQKIIQKVKQKHSPYGHGIEGVLARKSEMDKLPLPERYIQSVFADSGFNLIVTMLLPLAQEVHSARFTLHDNTYKRLHGEWKEWEVVIWIDDLNTRVTVARLYCTSETRLAYEMLWEQFFSTVERLTGRELQFYFIHKAGLLAILVDGNKPQIEGLGDVLVRRNKPELSGIPAETEPEHIVQYTAGTCMVHHNRNFDKLALKVPNDVMERIRNFPFIETQEELDSFIKFCEESEHKAVRDWWIDKKSCAWFIPCANRHFSKMSRHQWFTTPFDTNLNESSHPFTNRHTGTNLSILDAIDSAHRLDLEVARKIKLSRENQIITNHRGSDSQRAHRNRLRREASARKKALQAGHRNDLEDLDIDIEEHTQQAKEHAEKAKTLKKQRKELQKTTGVKRSRPDRAARGRPLDPEPMAEDTAEINEYGRTSPQEMEESSGNPQELSMADTDLQDYSRLDEDLALPPAILPIGGGSPVLAGVGPGQNQVTTRLIEPKLVYVSQGYRRLH